MAQIRIVDDWLRSPTSGPSHYRSIMVIAEKWAEQRVLMRAYAESRDPLRPTIVLNGTELAIGPAGLDLQGPWGIHVGDNAEVRAPEIKDLLETTARRLGGGNGRLADEAPPPGPEARAMAMRAGLAPVPGSAAAPGAAAVLAPPGSYGQAPYGAVPAALAAPPGPLYPELGAAPAPRGRPRAPQPAPGRTALGYTSGAGAQSAIVRLGLAPQVSARLGHLVDRVVPAEFHVDARERRVLDALGQGELTASGVGSLLELADPVSFMAELTRKLERYQLDLIELGPPRGGEPTYRLRC